MNFKQGDYIVLISSCDGNNNWEDQMPEGYCYQLSSDSSPKKFYVNLDIAGDFNGWECSFIEPPHDLLNFRLATTTEILEYQRLGKPFNIADLCYEDFSESIHREDLEYLVAIFKKLNIK